MALKGTLKDFSLADILQLIGIQRKTGVLNLKSAEDMVSISFVQGTIVSAESASQRLEERVANVLLKWGHCTSEQLAQARQRQQQTLERLWTVLLGQQAVTADEIRLALQLQVEKIIYPVFRWQDGEYSFIQETDIDFDRDHLIPIHAETVLMEGVRMMDEWPLLERKIRSEDLVLSRAPVQGQVVVGGDESGIDQTGENEIRMSAEEFRIYDLVDGTRTVAEIREISPTHDFDTTSVLCNLLGLGLIIPSGDRSSAREEETGNGKGRAPALIGSVLLCLAVAAVLAFAVPRIDRNPLNFFWRTLTDDGMGARLSMARDTTRLHLLERQLEAYRLEYGEYPGSLDDLAATGFAAPGDMEDSRGGPFVYLTRGQSFTLTVQSGPTAERELSPPATAE